MLTEGVSYLHMPMIISYTSLVENRIKQYRK